MAKRPSSPGRGASGKRSRAVNGPKADAGGPSPRDAATRTYTHPEAEALLRPDIGTQAQFRKRKPPKTYRYDSSLSPALDWDGTNSTRALGEWLLGTITRAAALPSPHRFERPEEFRGSDGSVIARVSDLADAVEQLRRIGQPFLNWAGKAERLSFDVPTLPLFVHERLSTQAILETLKGHTRDRQLSMFDLFGDPQHSVHEQVLRAYEHKDGWTNRLILGDSLVVMNSLLEYEGLGGQVQMIYMDPPYGVKFGSNFQPFVRKPDVKHGDDEDISREPEVVKAYRDTWELGLHSYLTYLRDRFLLCRDLLRPAGSLFVQIGDDNLHHIRELLDEVFGSENFVSFVPFRKKTMPLGAKHLESVSDYLLWYARDIERVSFQRLYVDLEVEGDSHWNYVELADGSRRKMTREELHNHKLLPEGAVPCQLMSLYPVGVNRTGIFDVVVGGRTFSPPPGKSWFTNRDGMARLVETGRLEPYETGDRLRYVLKLSDAPLTQLTNLWSDTSAPSDKSYAVQTSTKVIERCMLMTTRPGDLVLDPTCGSGTTAYVAERWGRRWISCDTSRVPLALARQRLLTATFPWFQLIEPGRGPVSGFRYEHRLGPNGRQTGGVVRVTTRGVVASGTQAEEVTRVDRSEIEAGVTRVCGPFTLEATIPTPIDWEAETEGAPKGEGQAAEASDGYGSSVDRLIEVLRKSPVLHLGGKKTVEFKTIRKPAKTLSLSAEALEVNGQDRPVALVFGPEDGAVSEKLVFEAAKEANVKNYQHLYVVGFAIQPNARELIEKSADAMGIPATYVQATPDLVMGDLLKTMRSSQIFSVCGLPDVKLRKLKAEGKGPIAYTVELLGLDVFDPVTMETETRRGDDVPAWFLDTDYNGLSFHVSQAFFPRTAAWDDLKRALKGTFEDSVWEHLAGASSAPFEAGDHGRVAIKVIDDRGNELLVVKSLTEAQG